MLFTRKVGVRLLLASRLLATAAGQGAEAAASYMAKNAGTKGVTALPSGLQYRVLASGPAGGLSPNASSPCVCHYRGTLTDGTVFDSSYERGKPATFAPNQVIGGWTEALQLMKEGVWPEPA